MKCEIQFPPNFSMFDERNRRELARLRRERQAIEAAKRAEWLLAEFYSRPSGQVEPSSVPEAIRGSLNGVPRALDEVFDSVRVKLPHVRKVSVTNALHRLATERKICRIGTRKKFVYTAKSQ